MERKKPCIKNQGSQGCLGEKPRVSLDYNKYVSIGRLQSGPIINNATSTPFHFTKQHFTCTHWRPAITHSLLPHHHPEMVSKPPSFPQKFWSWFMHCSLTFFKLDTFFPNWVTDIKKKIFLLSNVQELHTCVCNFPVLYVGACTI